MKVKKVNKETSKIGVSRNGDLRRHIYLTIDLPPSPQKCFLPCAKCPLCLNYGPDIMFDNCKHFVHTKCWNEWNLTFQECPCCV